MTARQAKDGIFRTVLYLANHRDVQAAVGGFVNMLIGFIGLFLQDILTVEVIAGANGLLAALGFMLATFARVIIDRQIEVPEWVNGTQQLGEDL